MTTANEYPGKFENYLSGIFLFLFVLRASAGVLPELDVNFSSVAIGTTTVLTAGLGLVGFLYITISLTRERNLGGKLGLVFLAWVLSLAPWVLLAALNFQTAGLSGLREWGRLLVVLIAFFTVYFITQTRPLRKIMKAIPLVLPVPLAVGYYQIINFSGDRIQGPMVHPNAYALFLVAAFGIVLWLYLTATSKIQYFWGVLLVTILPPLGGTLSSNGWLIFVVFLATVGLLAGLKPIYRGKFLLLGVVLLIGIGLVVSLQPVRFTEEAKAIISLLTPGDAGTGNGPANTIRERINIWKVLVKKWRTNPVLGYGLSTANYVNPIRALDPHNDYVKFLVNCGALGLFLFVTFEVLAGAILWKKYVDSSDKDLKLFGAIALGLFLGWVIASAGDNVINVTIFQLTLWSILAIFAEKTSSAQHKSTNQQ